MLEITPKIIKTHSMRFDNLHEREQNKHIVTVFGIIYGLGLRSSKIIWFPTPPHSPFESGGITLLFGDGQPPRTFPNPTIRKRKKNKKTKKIPKILPIGCQFHLQRPCMHVSQLQLSCIPYSFHIYTEKWWVRPSL